MPMSDSGATSTMAKDVTMYMAMPMHISPSGQQILPDDDDGVINVNLINISAQSWLKLDHCIIKVILILIPQGTSAFEWKG